MGWGNVGTRKVGTDGTFTSFSVGSDALRDRGTSQAVPTSPHIFANVWDVMRNPVSHSLSFESLRSVASMDVQ